MKLASITTHVSRVAVGAYILALLVPTAAQALAVTSRSATLGDSAPSAVTTYAYSFKPGTSGNIGSIKFQLCDSPVETDTCVNTGNSLGASYTSNSAAVSAQSGIAGFTVGTGTPPAPTANTLWISTSSPQNIANTTTINVTLQNVRNPSAPNKSYYSRITTYSDTAGSTKVDYGAVAIATTQSITVTGVMPESLVFCVGTTGTDCTNMTGTTVDLGVFSPTATSKGTSLMSASTNAGTGYVITQISGTMASGANTIPSMGTQSANSTGCAVSCTSTVGTSQFGTNVRANNVASAGGAFGADVTGLGTGTAFSGYATANSFRFFPGDTVASAPGSTKSNLYTNSYLVNVGGDQAAGVYTATMTYVCTATF